MCLNSCNGLLDFCTEGDISKRNKIASASFLVGGLKLKQMTCRIWRNWKKWKPIRDKILERDNYQCQFCQATFEQLKDKYHRETRLLIVHHIIPEHFSNDKVNEESNLVPSFPAIIPSKY